MARRSSIRIEVELDDARVPTAIRWQADDGGPAPAPCSAVTVTVWPRDARQLAAVALWTPELPVAEMYAFLTASLAQLADTCERATADQQATALIADCAEALHRLCTQGPQTT